jgi:hypothetical protein
MVSAKLRFVGVLALLSACGSSEGDGGGSGGAGGTGGSAGSAGNAGSAGSSGASGAAGASGSGGSSGSAGASGTSGSAGAAGQSTDGGTDGSSSEQYQLDGSASGASSDGTETATCTLLLWYSNLVHDGSGGWTADQAGEVFRTIMAGAQKYEFSALVGFQATLKKTATGVEFVLNDQPDPQAKPFWKELDVLEGTETSPGVYEGSWTCAPLLLDEPGFKDMKTHAPGTWKLAPMP